jgi:hypothetical protein
MKKLLVILFSLFSIVGFSQNSRTNVVSVDSTILKETLYSNALSFFAINFKSANNVIQMSDPISGKVIGKGIVDNRDVTISIFCKDGRYKYDINIEHKINEIDLPIRYLGISAYGNSGFTKVPLTIRGGVHVPYKNRAYFVYDNPQWDGFKYYYDGGVGHNPSLMTKGMWKKWKVLVDEELAKPKYNEIGRVPDTAFESLIMLLKNHMENNESSDW